MNKISIFISQIKLIYQQKYSNERIIGKFISSKESDY